MSTATRPPLTIERLGSEGDGMARSADGSLVAVPFALPGETIVNGITEVEVPDRTAAACTHFTVCGGCVAQHMSPALYATWKRDLLGSAFKAHRIDAVIEPLVTAPPRSRRRATFSLVKAGGTWRLGFHKRRDATVVPIDSCPVITPRMEAALPRLAELINVVPAVTETMQVYVADLDGGLEIVLEGASASAFSADQRARIAAFATAAGAARFVIGRETIVERAGVQLSGSAGALRPHPGAFFQAVAVAERAIVDAVIAGLPKKPKRIADLFCGIGTLTLPLARHAAVAAFDSDKPSLARLDLAVRLAQGLKPTTSRFRDLLGDPLSPRELEAFDTVVLDPPRAGARQQCERLAVAKVKSVVMVSCSPQTLARDARILIDGGFRLERATPIDQFLWSPHIEIVAVFQR